MKIVNLTPHDITVVGVEDGTVAFPKSGNVARVSEKRGQEHGQFEGVRVREASSYGEVEGLPAPPDRPGAGFIPYRERIIYIVSGLVAGACAGRDDVVSPGGLIRDASGAVIGCECLVLAPRA